MSVHANSGWMRQQCGAVAACLPRTWLCPSWGAITVDHCPLHHCTPVQWFCLVQTMGLRAHSHLPEAHHMLYDPDSRGVQGALRNVIVEATCQGAAAGSLRLRSAAANSPTWTEHLRGSAGLLQRPPASEPSAEHPDRYRRSKAAALVADAHLHEPQQPALATGGVTAGLELGSKHAAVGYGVHPAAADATLHCGAIDPAAPRDGRTRVPAALGALHVGSADVAQQV